MSRVDDQLSGIVESMLSGEDSVKFIRDRIKALGRGKTSHEKAAHKAITTLTENWNVPSDVSIDQDLAIAEQIGQDLADLQRHIADLQHRYMKALFGRSS